MVETVFFVNSKVPEKRTLTLLFIAIVVIIVIVILKKKKKSPVPFYKLILPEKIKKAMGMRFWVVF